ncbi:hypothetical protein LEP1GSC016_0194 [Leptospira borgpetersenii serovar Hardjo-bovis str. Sponselee]|uniref:Uncharacterized protein n=2 Tax=Leptospira borgpetersenii TaxID=174 RepID=M6BT14_LEPBO|nr:hypothetical protein LEP1GSC016_0194 [Leptospira borgpetersenii serovar Hardjo-bovis str. Sponselee]EMO62539.1 hypothetical protein LEP1GSC133_1677 [Leptospira borgpetersenii serovar Pomona str. 200901868]
MSFEFIVKTLSKFSQKATQIRLKNTFRTGSTCKNYRK